MLKHQVELDCCVPDHVNPDDELAVRKELSEYAAGFNCTAELVKLHGPGGGNPLVHFIGTRENLEELIEDHSPCDPEFYKTHIQQLPLE